MEKLDELGQWSLLVEEPNDARKRKGLLLQKGGEEPLPLNVPEREGDLFGMHLHAGNSFPGLSREARRQGVIQHLKWMHRVNSAHAQPSEVWRNEIITLLAEALDKEKEVGLTERDLVELSRKVREKEQASEKSGPLSDLEGTVLQARYRQAVLQEVEGQPLAAALVTGWMREKTGNVPAQGAWLYLPEERKGSFLIHSGAHFDLKGLQVSTGGVLVFEEMPMLMETGATTRPVRSSTVDLDRVREGGVIVEPGLKSTQLLENGTWVNC